MLPQPSSLVQVTVVLPTGKGEPDGGEQFTGRVPAQASFAVTVKYIFLLLAQVTAVTCVGLESTGGFVSCTVIVCTKLAL
jgi:hypothetical protein